MLNYFPKFFTYKAIYLYFGALMIVSLLFFSRAMDWGWFIFGLAEVVGFFYYSTLLTKKWSSLSEKKFTHNLFTTALSIRLVWVVFSYWFYTTMTGFPFEFHAADAHMYHAVASHLAQTEFGNLESSFWGLGISDRGYPSYLGVVYMLFGNNILIARLIKAVLSAYTCLFIYRFATRTFGENTGRMSAIFCMLMPNLIYYCGLHLKETEMLFLIVAFIERADYALRSNKLTFTNLALPILLAGSLFFFRTVLGAVALFSFFTAIIFSPSKMIKMGKRVILIAWIVVAAGYFMGGKIATEVEEVWENRGSNQKTSMEWRSTREGGNKFAKYISGAIFAPMILAIPFPTMVSIEWQENQQLIHGGNYDKNIMAFFTLFALFWVIKNRKWREYILIGSFTLGYLAVIAFSAFAQSERFHLPVLPFELIIAAFGVSLMTNKEKKYYNYYLAFIFIAIVGWNLFKLTGKGMI